MDDKITLFKICSWVDGSSIGGYVESGSRLAHIRARVCATWSEPLLSALGVSVSVRQTVAVY